MSYPGDHARQCIETNRVVNSVVGVVGVSGIQFVAMKETEDLPGEGAGRRGAASRLDAVTALGIQHAEIFSGAIRPSDPEAAFAC